MLHRFDAYMNGVSLAHLDPAIILRDIEEMKPTVDKQEYKRSLHAGSRITDMVRRSLPVKFVLCVREYDITARARLLDRIAEWAGTGGWLTINSRPGQRLYVTPDELPAMGSGLRWTEDVTMTLTAYERPYWEQQYPVTAIITETGSIAPLGTMPEAQVECDIVNAGDGNLTRIEITCGETKITLEGVDVAPGQHVILSYTDTDVLQIMAGGVSALANRTAESSDDLIAMTRKANDIAVSADQPVSAVFRARGRFR